MIYVCGPLRRVMVCVIDRSMVYVCGPVHSYGLCNGLVRGLCLWSFAQGYGLCNGPVYGLRLWSFAAQGYGLFATEEVKWSATGRLCNTGPASYRLPRFSDLPAQFNVSLLKGASNPHAIYSSKVRPPTDQRVLYVLDERLQPRAIP